MDPNASLAEINGFLRDFHHYLRQGSSRETLQSCLANLAEGATALEEWIAKGGFLPDVTRAPGLDEYDKVADAQGWNDDSEISLLRAFVRDQTLAGELAKFAREVARQENEG